MNIQAYLDAVKLKLAISPVVSEAEIVQERSLEDRGFLRARLRLINADFVEAAEFFLIDLGQVRTVEYRYQWMDPKQQRLRRRWDNAAHYPGLPNFPHHIHVGHESQVESGAPISILELIDLLEQELGEML